MANRAALAGGGGRNAKAFLRGQGERARRRFLTTFPIHVNQKKVPDHFSPRIKGIAGNRQGR
jgi:hypothetical protein